MDVGNTIRNLRLRKGIRQEQLAAEIGVSMQTVSRWENNVNYPDISMLPILASYFNVTTDHLLDIKGGKTMAKLLKTMETFELPDKQAAENMGRDFKAAGFPKLKDYQLRNEGEKVILEVVKEFGMDLEKMEFGQ